MSVSLRVDDGPPGAEWLSPDIKISTVRQAENLLAQPVEGRNNYIFVGIHNDGADPITFSSATCDCGALGQFLPPQVLESDTRRDLASAAYLSQREGTSADGSLTISTFLLGQHAKWRLKSNSTSQTMGDGNLPDAPAQWGFGFSPDGRSFIRVMDTGVGPSAIALIATVNDAGGFGTSSTLEGMKTGPWGLTWGFGPDGRTFVYLADFTNAIRLVVYQRKDDGTTLRWMNISPTSPLPAGQITGYSFSPCGDLLAIFGGGSARIFKVPDSSHLMAKLSEWVPTSKGFPQTLTLTSGTPSLNVRRAGQDGIDVAGISVVPAGGSRIDNPSCASSTGLAVVDAFASTPTTLPLRSKMTWLGGSYYAIGASGTPIANVDVLIVPPWIPGFLGHACLIAETETLGSEDTLGVKEDDFHVIDRRKVAQRNVVVQMPLSPFFAMPFHVDGSADVSSDVRLTLQQPSLDEALSDPSLKGLPRRQASIRRAGLKPFCTPRDLCEPADDLEKEVTLELGPGDRRHFVAEFEIEGTEEEAVAIVNVVERRGGQVTGGITVIGAPEIPPPIEIDRGDVPTPVSLLGQPFRNVGEDPPGLDSSGSDVFRVGTKDTQTLVARFVTSSDHTLHAVGVYLEGISDRQAVVEPRIHYLGDMERGTVAQAQWHLVLTRCIPGTATVSFVAEDADGGRWRLLGTVRMFAADPPDLSLAGSP